MIGTETTAAARTQTTAMDTELVFKNLYHDHVPRLTSLYISL